MTTTAVSSSTSTSTAATNTATTPSASALAAANKASAQSLITSLGAGSGVDVNALAQNLVGAERAPQENAINAKITKNEARISGYSAISYVVSQVQTAFAAIKDQTSFASLTVSSSNTGAFTVTAGASAVAGTHDIDVLQLSKPQRSVSTGMASGAASLNAGQGLTLKIAIGSASGITPTVVTQQGSATSTESSSVTFQDMVAGQTVTVGGLTYKSTGATTAAQVASIFSGLTPTSTLSSPGTGTLSGALQGFTAGAATGTGSLTFTSTTDNASVTDLTVAASNPATSASSISISLADGKDTPQAMVDAINAAGTGVKAQLVNTGDGTANPYQIALTGATGAAGVFSVSADYGSGTGTPGVAFTNNQEAMDAQVRVDGITYKRASNTMTDVIPGATLNLTGTTTTTASVNLSRDTTAIKDKINTLVTSYNDAITMLNVVSDPKSTVATYGATLVGDSTVRLVKQQLRAMFVGASSTPGTSVNSLWQMGLSIDQTGVMAADATKLDAALTNNFDDVVTTFTGNQNNLSTFSTTPGGIAGDAVKKLTALLGTNGPMLSQSETATNQNTKYQDQLTKLGVRMDSLLARYQKQFAAMNSLVGSVNSQKTSLKATFDGMMATYTNK